MPTYEYRCKDCDHELEAVQGFHDDPLTVCPSCGGTLRKKFGAVGISFKGSGFYKTDSRSKAGSTSSSATDGSSGESSSSGASGSDASSSTSSDAGSSGSGASKSSGSSGESKPTTKAPAPT